jgi:hypothetical protein
MSKRPALPLEQGRGAGPGPSAAAGPQDERKALKLLEQSKVVHTYQALLVQTNRRTLESWSHRTLERATGWAVAVDKLARTSEVASACVREASGASAKAHLLRAVLHSAYLTPGLARCCEAAYESPELFELDAKCRREALARLDAAQTRLNASGIPMDEALRSLAAAHVAARCHGNIALQRCVATSALANAQCLELVVRLARAQQGWAIRACNTELQESVFGGKPDGLNVDPRLVAKACEACEALARAGIAHRRDKQRLALDQDDALDGPDTWWRFRGQVVRDLADADAGDDQA